MQLSVNRTNAEQIAKWRDIYRQEMHCQIIHDSIHSRPGWTLEYSLHCDGTAVGYGSVTVGGPWKGKPTIYEFFLRPHHRSRLFDLFAMLIQVSGATHIETQSNDVLLTVLLHCFAENIVNESILFEDREKTTHPAPLNAAFRRVTSEDAEVIQKHELDAEAAWMLEVDRTAVAAGDILYHYNRPYGDIYMKVAEPFRQRGLGTYLVQELKRVCYEGGSIPAARCNPKNVASRNTLQRAGFAPCGNILVGSVQR